MRISLGTSGFQYPEWKGGFYPETMPVAKMLAWYAERFSSTESNYSFRHLPSAKTIASWAEKTPDDFTFSFKAPQKVTHFAKLRNCAETMGVFHAAVSPMGPKLGPVLFQLPPTFRRDTELLRAFLAELPKGLRAAFEFREASWFAEEVYDALREAGAALCVAESEKLLTPSIATAGFGYLRLRREDYTSADLRRWADWISAQAAGWSECYLYFKHEETGVGPKFGAEMAGLLGVTRVPAATHGDDPPPARAKGRAARGGAAPRPPRAAPPE